MPAINPSGSGNSGQPQRTTFRPPWVRDGPEPLPLPTAPWTLARTRDQKNDVTNAAPKPSTVKLRAASIDHEGSSSSASGRVAAGKPEHDKEKSPKAEPVRKQSKITIVPSMLSSKSTKENGHETAAVSKTNDETKKEQLVPKRKLTQERKNKSIDAESRLKEQESIDNSNSSAMPIEIMSVKTQEKPAAPPLPPPPPPPQGFKKEPLNKAKAEKLEILKNRPRKRPDWGTLMKDIECQRKLKHVQCNDRSSPLLPKVKVKEGFMYESEKANVHNQLLKEIQSGISLKRVQTNDRSKPLLEGLRKFRRQLTIEEQIQKATEAEVVEAEPDELDDIDKVRDDLQSTKQMLALELRNKEAVERENKRLLAKFLNLESELEREKAANKQAIKTPETANQKHEQDLKALNNKLTEQENHAKEMENMYHDVASQLDLTKNELEEAVKKNKLLEHKLAAQAKGGEAHVLMKQPSSKKIPQSKEMKDANNVDENNAYEAESEYEEVTETEEESDESSEDSETDKAALQEKRTARELKLLSTKLKALKEKEVTANKERRSLRDQLKKQQKALREEKKKYKELQKEVDKMANLMKDDEEEEETEDKSETDEESESDSESESEESVDERSEGDLPLEAPADDKKKNLTERSKRHENSLTVLKKGNYMLKANIDRLKDELFKQKEMSITLQEDLNSVLAELG